MLHEVEAGIQEFRHFLDRTHALKSDHAIQRAYEYLRNLKKAGYGDLQEVHALQEEIESE
ncbi:MAG TPA: hypothetical protein VHD63_12090 [Ktedonobacteraceae bacterium]|jgi:hypothetical protein|nr:hypothetical protein [Ktedonobacteraceae bacterium]